MNRLTNYFESAKLAKLMMLQAEEAARKGDRRLFELSVTSGMTYLISAMNNVASIAFNKKPKRR